MPEFDYLQIASTTSEIISADTFTIVYTVMKNGMLLGIVLGLVVRSTRWLWPRYKGR